MPKICVKPSTPGSDQASHVFGRQLDEAIESLNADGQYYQVAEFDRPRQAHWYRMRLHRKYGPQGYEITAGVTDGIGRIYARRLPSD
jgi:hypothetical protein